MKRGFTQTLMMVAIVLMAAQAMAMAPVISEIPSPVVGDKDSVTPANTFVYPDALNLANYVSDHETTDSTQISWFYESSNHHYRINNSDEVTATDIINFATPEGIANIAASKIIAGPGNVNRDTTGTQEAGSTWITVRNEFLSPIAGGTYQAPANQDSETEVVTLYASDGETVSLPKTVYFYTHAGENDHLSPGGGIPVSSHTFVNTLDGYTYSFLKGNASHAVTDKGLCWGITLNETQDTITGYTSPTDEIQLVKNNVYKIRMVVNGTQTTYNQTPLWDCVIANNNAAENYGADFFMYDTNGSENAYVQFTKGNGDTEFQFWWTPIAVLTPRWNNTDNTDGGAGIWGNDYNPDNRGGTIQFRMICEKASKGALNSLHASLAEGTMCLKSIETSRYEIDTLKTDPTPVYQSTGFVPGTDFSYESNVNTSMTAATDGVVIKSTAASGQSNSCYASIAPGNGNVGDSTAANNTEHEDDFPCVMEPKTLYKMTYTLSAPAQADMNSPVDAIWLAMSTFSLEAMQENYCSAQGWYHAMPDLSQQPYVTFFYSNYGTNNNAGTPYPANPAWWSCFKPRLAFTNNWNYFAYGAKTGAFKLHGIKVEKVVSGM